MEHDHHIQRTKLQYHLACNIPGAVYKHTSGLLLHQLRHQIGASSSPRGSLVLASIVMALSQI